MQRKNICLFLTLHLYCLLLGCSSTLNITGNWKGKMIQLDGPRGKDGYDLFFEVTQEDSLVRGISRIEIPQTEYYGVMRINGTVRNDTLYFREYEILEQKARPEHSWCMKEGALKFEAKKKRLSGHWASSNCAPGEIDLTRVKK